MARRPGPLPSSLGAVFTAEQARAVGVTAARLRARDIERPYRGVLSHAPAFMSECDPDAPLARDRQQHERVRRQVRLYQPVMQRHSFFCDRTAAVLWGLPLAHGDDLDVGVPAPRRAPRGAGIRGRQVRADLVTLRELDGFRLTSPASTWAMLGARLSVRRLVHVGDAIVRVPRDRGGYEREDLQLASRAQLQAAIDAGRRPGVARLREAIEMVRVGSASPLETDFRLDAAADGLPEPELDIEIRDARGVLIGVTELGYRDYRVLVEIEGDHHRTSKEQWNRDIEKYAAYVAQGFEMVRLTGAHIRGPHRSATARVREALIRHG